MPKMVLEEAKEFGVLPDETLILVEVQEIKERPVPGKDGGEGWVKLEFKFIIRDLPGHMRNDEAYAELIGSPIWGSVTMKFTMHPDNKLRQWTEALLNMGELDAGFELDTDMLLNRQAKAVTGSYTRRDGQKRHEITGLLPAGPLGGSPVNVPSFLQDPPRVQDNPPYQPPAQPAAQPVQQPVQAAAPVPAWATLAGDDDPPF